MKTIKQIFLSATLAISVLALTASGQAQIQTTGTPGSPDATTTIDGRYIPSPPQPFQGQINLNALQSKTGWPARVVPPKGAPNILLIMTDDVGFGAPSTWGASSQRRRWIASPPTACGM
jgi:arylsulfatase